MKRLIIIGNGFDLAHGLKTDYNSFIVWYLNRAIEITQTSGCYDDLLLKIDRVFENYPIKFLPAIKDLPEYVDYFYTRSIINMINNDQYLNINSGVRQLNPFNFTFKSKFFQKLISQCSNSNWVDIENEFYAELRSFISITQKEKQNLLLDDLNNTIGAISQELEEFLKTRNSITLREGYKTIFNASLLVSEMVGAAIKKNSDPDDVLILNFNYTPTVEYYFNRSLSEQLTIPKIKVNYIHGQLGNLKNPLIFGFGDELDNQYPIIENLKNNRFFEYIKSFWYFKSSNYHDLLRFLESDEYQVYILGHSCGLSDRTLLNMIFENLNCKSIKIFYHEKNKGKDNFKTLTQEISRHFKDKVSMRRKIVPFDKSQKMPQYDD